GNFATCLVGLLLNDCGGNSTATISGDIQNEEGEDVEGVMVYVENANMNDQEETGIDGFFSFILNTDQNYVVRPEKDVRPLNGVSTYDLVIMSKHILGIEALTSPYKLIAADVNNSGEVTAFDMVDLRKLILFIDTEFQNNTSWRFVPTDHVFPNNDPFTQSFPEVYDINDLSSDMEVDFVGIKIGDLNDSARPNLAIGSQTRSAVGDLNLETDDISMKAGETYTVAINAENFAAISGYQFTMNFDQDAVEFAGVESNLEGLTSSNFGTSLLGEGALTTSWNSEKGMDAEGAIFTLTLRAKRDAELSEVLSISSDYTSAEAYTSNADLLDVKLTFHGTVSNDFALLQNVPNPFKDETVIGFVLPKASAASITIYDVSGKVLRLIEGEYNKGYNEVDVNRSELNGAGVLYYTLETADYSATKKMIILE
ncbi:MAG: cohesin domain-containing protein, partial [Bacteroidota bacterium]